MAHYDTFRTQLAITHPAFGHALWEPDPGAQYPAVEVGDVGFIRQGKFHRLFNVLFTDIHPSNQRFGVPEDHKLLTPVPNHIDRGTLYPNSFCSYGVVTSDRSQVQSVEPAAPGSIEVSFSCRSKYGAVLSLPIAALREDTLAQEQFRRWIIQHIDSWFSFSQQRGLGIEMEDIVLVTGFHRTRSWSNIAFYENQMNAQVSFGFQVPSIFGATVNWQVSGQDIQGAVLSHGPSGENLPDSQCIFVRGFRVKRTLKMFPRVKGAAEPVPDPSGNDDEPEKETVSIPSSEYLDPLHVLLEYIGERAPHCDLVLVHDDDLERILRVGEGSSLNTLQPAEVMSYLRSLKFDVEVEVTPGAHTKDLFPANDESSRTDTKHRKVAMLSEELKPLGDGHTIFGDGADQLGQNTITDYVSSDHSPASSLLFSPTTSVTSLSSINLTDMNTAPPFPSNRLWGSVGVRENSQFLQPSLSLFNAAQGQALLQPAVPLVGPVDTTRRIDRLRAQRQAITHRSQIVPVTHGNSARPSSGNFNVPPTAMDGADVINIMGEHYVYKMLNRMLVDFGPKNWTSKLRHRVPGFAPFHGTAYADFTYEDTRGQLTFEWFGPEKATAWHGRWPRYHIEVKSTRGEESEPFHMSRAHMITASRFSERADVGTDIYVVVRVSRIGMPEPSYMVYADPHRLLYDRHLQYSHDVYLQRNTEPQSGV